MDATVIPIEVGLNGGSVEWSADRHLLIDGHEELVPGQWWMRGVKE
jgi:hypothetical protein